MKVLDLIKNEVIDIIDNDPAHDFEHVMRVYNNAKKIVKKEKANQKLVLSAVLLHDIVSYPKSSKRSKFSSVDSAKKSKIINQPNQSAKLAQWEMVEKNLIGLRRLNDDEVEGIRIIAFNDQQRISSFSIYKEGKLDNGKLVIADPSTQKIFDFTASFLPSNNLLENFSLPSLLTLKNTYQLEKDLQKIDSLIYSKALLPISIIAIIFLAGSLMFDSTRSGGVGRQIIIGISIGIIYDLIKDLSIASFLTYQWPILIAHLLPITILIGLGTYKFQRI